MYNYQFITTIINCPIPYKPLFSIIDRNQYYNYYNDNVNRRNRFPLHAKVALPRLGLHLYQ